MSPNFNKFNYLYFIHSNTRFFEGVRRFHRPSKGPWRKERVRIPVVREHGPLQLRMSLCLNVSTNVPAVCLLAASVMVQRVSEIRKWPHRNTRTKHGTCPLKWAEHLKRPRKMFLGAFAKLWKGLLASLCPSVCMELVGRLLVDSTFLLRTALVMYLSCPEIKATYLFFLSTNKAENSILRWNKFEFSGIYVRSCKDFWQIVAPQQRLAMESFSDVRYKQCGVTEFPCAQKESVRSSHEHPCSFREGL